jgi:hypothetical protein
MTASKTAVFHTSKCGLILYPNFFCTIVNQIKRLLALSCCRFEAIRHKFHCKSLFKKTFSEREAVVATEVFGSETQRGADKGK